MKNKEILSKPSRKWKAFLTVAFTIIIALLTVSVTVFAENAFRVENCNKCEKYSQKLGEKINGFIELDTEPNKTVSTQVTAAINEYRKKIIDLQSHPEVEKRDLENDILLAYTQGDTAGDIAWVYYYNIYTFESSSSIDKINAKYASCKSSIANATQYTVLEAERSVMLDELNRLIYSERALNLALPNDSLSASSLISGAVEEFKSLYSDDLFGKGYATEYDALVKELGLQRVRDALKSEAEQVFKAILPNESFSTSSSASLLIYELNTAKSVKAMNNAAVSFVKELLKIDESKPYSTSAKKQYLSLCQDAASRATENQTAARLAEIFGGYSLSVKKAEIKDSIYALLLGDGSETDENLIDLEQEFNRDGGVIDNCKTDEETDAELINAKSTLFIHKHQGILNKPFDDLMVSDEQDAKNALIEYSTLEESVKQKLLNEINIIAEKYNSILIIKIEKYLPSDALYLDFCEIITKEIKSVSRKSIDEFYNTVSRIPKKAEAISIVVKEYRDILSTENYGSFDSLEKENLLKTLDELSQNLSKIDPTDVAIYFDEISNAQANAIRRLNVINQCARVRIATRSSKNAEISTELNTAYERISACSEKSEMILQANRAIYKIERLLTSDAITNSCQDLKNKISAMEFLEKSEKEGFYPQITALESKAKSAREAENITVLEEIWNSFSSSLSKICSEAAAIDLARAISVYLEEITATVNSHIEQLKKLEYISKEKCDEIYNSINQAQVTVKELLPLCKSTASVLTEYAKFIEKLNDFSNLADHEDLIGYKAFLLTKFDQYEEIKANYSVENYNKILDIKTATSNKLSLSTSRAECESILSSALSEILLINDLLDDEKDSALTSLLSLLEKLKKDSPLYSKANFSKIEGLYDEAKIEIGKITDISSIASVKQILSKYLSLLSEVRKDSLYTSESAHKIATPSLQYPEDYDYSNGLLGSIHLSGGIISDASFSVKLLEQTRNKEIEDLIRRSAKKGTLITFQKLSSSTQKLLRSASVAATLDISLSKIDEGASGYTVQMLIPNDLCNENILGLAFVNDGKVEFYPINQADSLISVRLDHFSKYYIVVESTLNVKPLLIALIILLCIEFLVLIAIIYLRYKRKTEYTNNSQSDLPELPMAAIIPFTPTLTRIFPENGIPLVFLLSVAAIALASTIALLIRSEARQIYLLKEAEKQKQLKGRKEALLLNEAKPNEKEDELFFSNERDGELCKVGVNIKNTANRAEIDLDIISESFRSTEVVNIQALKQKGLVPEDVEYVKILTKGNLTKPLIIEANEFSNAAREIVRLSGGEIRIVEK